MLYKLLSQSDRQAYVPAVISLSDVGPIGKKIESLGVEVKALGMRPGRLNLLALLELRKLLRSIQPDIVQSWMYHADLMSGLASLGNGKWPRVWGIRQSDLDPHTTKRMTRAVAWVSARLSGTVPTRIVCCSHASARVHSDIGYDREKMTVIPNGFDVSLFRPDPEARRAIRAELRIPEEAVVIGLVARLDPQKDHATFFRAASSLALSYPDVHFILAGKDLLTDTPRVAGWLPDDARRARFHLLGIRGDVAALNAAFDIACSSSAYGEGFPNVIGEAMASGVPCVVTDVGDSATIVGETGFVVKPRSDSALADALARMIEEGPERRADYGRAARERVIANFNLPIIVRMFEQLYDELLMP